MSAETELTLTGDEVTRERLTRSVPLPLQSSPIIRSDAVAVAAVPSPPHHEPVTAAGSRNNIEAPSPPITRRTVRQRRRLEAQQRREARRHRRQDRAAANRHSSRRRRHNREPQQNNGSVERTYRSFCKLLSIVLLPVVVLLALIGVILFGVFFCLPLLFFLIGLLCMYYCCTKEPVPPRTLWRALTSENVVEAPPEAPVTPPGLTVEQIHHLIIKRKCLGIETALTVRACLGDAESVPRADWGVNLLEHQVSQSIAYWPITSDSEPENVAYYLFTAPLSMVAMKSIQAAETDNGTTAPPQQAPRDTSSSFDISDNDSKQGEEDADLEDADLEEAVVVPQQQQCQDWPCPACTYNNEFFSRYCFVCTTPRPLQLHASTVTFNNDANHDDNGQVRDDAQFLEACEFFGLTPHEAWPEGYPSQPQSTCKESVVIAPDTAASCPAAHGGVCDICLGDYEVGDIVAWSNNPLCKHAFHVECISDWLIRRPTCPSCRQVYIEIPPSMKNAAVENFFAMHHQQERATALETASAFRIGLDMGTLDESVSSSSSEQNSVNQAIMFDDTEGSSLELGSDDPDHA